MTNDPQSCVQLLQQMVSFDTVNRVDQGTPFVEGKLAGHLEEVAKGWGLDATRLPIGDVGFNLLITHQQDAQAPWLLFDSHLDTVGVAGMTIDPFAAVIKDGKVFGRGACDTKGTGAAMLWALKSLTAERRLAVNVAILYSIDEEATRTGVKAFIGHQLGALDWRPVGVIVGEPTCLKMVTAHNGTVRWQIRAEGVAAHSSDPSQGRSAISDMVRVIQAIETQYIPYLEATHRLVGKAQCSINLISGGTLINIIPDTCYIDVDRRTVPGEDPATVLPAVEQVLQTIRNNDPALRVRQLQPRIEPALSPETNASLSNHAASILRLLELPTEHMGAKYGTHASNFADADLPAIVLGPGDIAQAHCKDEYIAIEQLDVGVRLYQQLMTQSADFWTGG